MKDHIRIQHEDIAYKHTDILPLANGVYEGEYIDSVLTETNQSVGVYIRLAPDNIFIKMPAKYHTKSMFQTVVHVHVSIDNGLISKIGFEGELMTEERFEYIDVYGRWEYTCNPKEKSPPLSYTNAKWWNNLFRRKKLNIVTQDCTLLKDGIYEGKKKVINDISKSRRYAYIEIDPYGLNTLILIDDNSKPFNDIKVHIEDGKVIGTCTKTTKLITQRKQKTTPVIEWSDANTFFNQLMSR